MKLNFETQLRSPILIQKCKIFPKYDEKSKRYCSCALLLATGVLNSLNLDIFLLNWTSVAELYEQNRYVHLGILDLKKLI